MASENSQQWAIIFTDLENIILNNYWRKYYTYKEIGWDEQSITEYLSKRENIMKIASFNTTTTSFSASSRRNRYYEIFDREDMLDKDVAYEGAIEGLKKINKLYKIYITSSRKTPLEDKTLKVMENLGFDLSILNIKFLPPNQKLYQFRRESAQEIVKEFPAGVGICLNPSEKPIFDRFSYTPIAFTSIKNYEEFNGEENSFNVICQDWNQLLSSLNVQ